MSRVGRSERLVYISQALLDRPGAVFPLSFFSERLGAAKSSISEDLALLGDALEQLGIGVLETYPGAAGGVAFWPQVSHDEARQLAQELCRQLADPARILPGGFLYMTDLMFNPDWANRFGRLFATRFRAQRPEYVVTVETKGIPVALMTARALNRPLVVIRRDNRVTEGPALSINFLSGSTGRIGTMSLPRRAVPAGARVLLVDDFMKAGGTARGMLDLMAELDARVVGMAVLVETAQPAEKVVREYVSLAVLESVDERRRQVVVRPSAWILQGERG